MQYRALGRTGFNVSTISFGAWAVGGTWGTVDDSESLKAMNRAVDLGVNFFDTADVYGDGRSEKLIRQLKSERSEEIIVATKFGRRLNPHILVRSVLMNLNDTGVPTGVVRIRENPVLSAFDVHLFSHLFTLRHFPESFAGQQKSLVIGRFTTVG